ncbi:hypothetical protein CASFOL_040872 [Castilleja foliolosa]|uniref:Uncharacterized protein n=1 Tax=Castilleja foliolosa TaxID=1961234 RepID=A0ABD3BDR9_9LAMI
MASSDNNNMEIELYRPSQVGETDAANPTNAENPTNSTNANSANAAELSTTISDNENADADSTLVGNGSDRRSEIRQVKKLASYWTSRRMLYKISITVLENKLSSVFAKVVLGLICITQEARFQLL